MNLTRIKAGPALADPPIRLRPGRGPRHGYTLIEVVAVMAIIAILAAALVPSVMKQMDEAARKKESCELKNLAEGFRTHVLRSRNIPNYTNWAAAISDDLDKPVFNITTTPRGYGRVFLIDPNLRIAGSGLPYTQGTNGSSRPVSPRLLLLTSIGAALPVSTGIPTATSFNDIWNTPPATRPSTWTSWTGDPRDLLIQRINLEPLFHRLILVDLDSANVGQFSIAGSSPRSVPTNAVGQTAYYLDGTAIGLHDAAGALQTRELLKSDISYVFEYGYWRNQLHDGRMARSRGQQFALAISQFLATTRNSTAVAGASQQSAVDQMYYYLFTYTLWASDSPCFSRGGSTTLTGVPQYQELTNAQTRLNTVTRNLIQ